jgi:hypothetical protein
MHGVANFNKVQEECTEGTISHNIQVVKSDNFLKRQFSSSAFLWLLLRNPQSRSLILSAKELAVMPTEG